MRIKGLGMLDFRKILRTYLMDDPFSQEGPSQIFDRVLDTPLLVSLTVSDLELLKKLHRH